MSAIHLAWNPVDQQLASLRALAEKLRRDVVELRAENAELRRENAELRQQVNGLRCDVGYWKSRHADAVERNTKLQAELEEDDIRACLQYAAGLSNAKSVVRTIL